MSIMNISLPDSLKSFVDGQVSQHGYASCSDYVLELILKEADRQRLREMLLDGAASAPMPPVDAAYFAALRERVNKHVAD